MPTEDRLANQNPLSPSKTIDKTEGSGTLKLVSLKA